MGFARGNRPDPPTAGCRYLPRPAVGLPSCRQAQRTQNSHPTERAAATANPPARPATAPPAASPTTTDVRKPKDAMTPPSVNMSECAGRDGTARDYVPTAGDQLTLEPAPCGRRSTSSTNHRPHPLGVLPPAAASPTCPVSTASASADTHGWVGDSAAPRDVGGRRNSACGSPWVKGPQVQALSARH